MELFIEILACGAVLGFVLARFRSRPPFPLDSQEVEIWAMRYFPDDSRGIAVLAANILIRQSGISLEELSPASRVKYELKAYFFFKPSVYFRALEESFGTAISVEDRSKIKDFGTLVNYLRECPREETIEPEYRKEPVRNPAVSKPIQMPRMQPLANL